MRNLESLAAVNKIGGWLKVLMKIFIKNFDIYQESNLTEGPTNYIPLVREDSSYYFPSDTLRQFIETPLMVLLYQESCVR